MGSQLPMTLEHVCSFLRPIQPGSLLLLSSLAFGSTCRCSPLLGPWIFPTSLGSGVARLPGAHRGFTFVRHTPKPDFLSPVTSTGTQCMGQANYGSFVTKTLW